MYMNHPDWQGKEKSHGRGGSWVIAAKITAHLMKLAIWSCKTFFNVSSSPPDPAFLSSGARNSISSHSPVCLPNSWWLKRASLGWVPVWLYNFTCWFQCYPLRPHSGSTLPIPYEGTAHVYNLFRAFSAPS